MDTNSGAQSETAFHMSGSTALVEETHVKFSCTHSLEFSESEITRNLRGLKDTLLVPFSAQKSAFKFFPR